ncbi:aromatic compound dioxygenase [Pyrenochaeta sp. DS3sAY3a]|nr:aromatic compound dioxygenase [Pyrenochaeta sp. DS3sAY3a]
MNPSTVEMPPILNMNVETITKNAVLMNSQNPDLRMKFVLDRLVHNLHNFARETRLSTDEWMQGIEFLTAVGQMCTNLRQEMILLSDVLGLSVLVDSIDHPKPSVATEGTVLGPFHTLEAHSVASGSAISNDEDGEPLLVLCTIRDTDGKPVEAVKVDVWETDSKGFYDVQHKEYNSPDGRCILHSDKDGVFWFKAIKPVSYPIPHDGPVGHLLKKLHRHPYRPSHMHFMFEKEGYDHLITALYLRSDPYLTSDAVFGVKDSLIVDMPTIDEDTAKQYLTDEERKDEKKWSVLKYDFVIVSDQEVKDLREQNSIKALQELGQKVKIKDGLPIPDVD